MYIVRRLDCFSLKRMQQSNVTHKLNYFYRILIKIIFVFDVLRIII